MPGTYPGTTHRIILEAMNNTAGARTVLIRLKQIFPPKWVMAGSTADDTNIGPKPAFATTTFGLQPMLTGIHQAYDVYATDKAYLLSLSLQ